ncbi:histidine kinase dimerization/phosphoacceptor domain -containing protein [Marinoscillum pacificum]|uniref:histidine kinase dimerization/phosphoacceptor domain -containing protein n=1 Tax=Marinoscillum pacificum TaxID=392723 RepID=UPI002157CF81|nr:histidine kinase dimerization/phosphoacceptor domain -containing protein [Marinoscillum pacificum]
MKLITGILLCVGLHCSVQSTLQWKKLPEPSKTRAFVRHGTASIDTIASAKPPTKIQTDYLGSPFQFKCVIKPKHIPTTYEKHPLEKRERVATIGGMLFKDQSTANIKYLDKAHGLPSNQVLALAKGSDGRMYFGTEESLVIYNGQELEIYSGAKDHPFHNIRSLFFDHQERLWISTDAFTGYIQDGHLYLPESQIFGPTHLKGFNECKKTGEVFIFTRYNGLFVLRNDSLLHFRDQLPVLAVSATIRDSENRLWLVYSHDGISYIQNDSLYHYDRPGVFNTPRSVYEYEQEIYFGQFTGYLMKFRNDSLFSVKWDNTEQHRIFYIEGNEHGLWLADYSKGVVLIKNNQEALQVTARQGLVNNASYAILKDDFNNLWVGDALDGVSRIDEYLFSNSDKPIVGLIKNAISDSENTWYLTNSGIYREHQDQLIAYNGIGKYCLDGLIENEDDIWLSNADQGLTLLQSNDITYYTINENLSEDSTIYFIQKDNLGNIWGQDLADRLICFSDGYFLNYSNTADFKNYRFKSLTTSASGIVLALTVANGVIAIKNNQYQHINANNLLSGNLVDFVFEDSQGRQWFCQPGFIEMIDKTGNKVKLENPTLKNNTVKDILEIGANRYLLMTKNGVIWLEGDQDYEAKLYGNEYGINVLDNENLNIDHHGEIFLLGGNQLMTFNPEFRNLERHNPKLSLNRLLINDSTISNPHDLEVAQQNNLRYIFNVINWGRNAALYYKLEREGQPSSAKWNTLTGTNIPFNELTHGQYELSVYAMDGNQQSNIWKTHFTITPYWYQTTWFLLFIFLSFSGLIIGYFLFKQRKTIQDKKKLEAQVAERTEELVYEKERVLRQLEEKEVLRQEVHHRVKNNLTFLKSLLFLRSRASSSEEVKIILDECQARIQTMALVHQNLYDVDDTVDINFSSFIKELFVELHTLFETNKSVGIQIEAGDIKMDMKSSIFIGLIFNELITNSFKYAFSYIEKPVIYVHVSESDSQTFLEYWDNGQGLTEGFDITKTKGFGFKIMNILVQQTDATLEYKGQKFLLTIPKNR